MTDTFKRFRPQTLRVDPVPAISQRVQRLTSSIQQRDGGKESPVRGATLVMSTPMSTFFRKKKVMYKVSHPGRYITASPGLSLHESRRAMEVIDHHEKTEADAIRAAADVARTMPLLGKVYSARNITYRGSNAVLTCMPSYDKHTPLSSVAMEVSQGELDCLVGQALMAFAHLNMRGVYHNDAAPRNVLISPPLESPLRVRTDLVSITVPKGCRTVLVIDYNQSTCNSPWGVQDNEWEKKKLQCPAQFVNGLVEKDVRLGTSFMNSIPQRSRFESAAVLRDLIVDLVCPTCSVTSQSRGR